MSSDQQVIDQLINQISDKGRQAETRLLLNLFTNITGEEPKYWPGNMIGFGSYHYVYESGREGDWFMCGFAPRAQKLSLYLLPSVAQYKSTLDKLGQYKLGKSCLYINKLTDVDLETLKTLILEAYSHMHSLYKK
jgi:hypothetical protein